MTANKKQVIWKTITVFTADNWWRYGFKTRCYLL